MSVGSSECEKWQLVKLDLEREHFCGVNMETGLIALGYQHISEVVPGFGGFAMVFINTGRMNDPQVHHGSCFNVWYMFVYIQRHV